MSFSTTSFHAEIPNSSAKTAMSKSGISWILIRRAALFSSRAVYGVELKNVLTHQDLAVGSYRFAISRLIPQMTQGRAADPQERTDARDTELWQTEVSLSSFALRARKGVGQGLC
jgi:hypothetical protein